MCSCFLGSKFFFYVCDNFRFPLDLIKVTEGTPLFSAEESAEVIRRAEEEGVDKNEYESGKYKLGGNVLLIEIFTLIRDC